VSDQAAKTVSRRRGRPSGPPETVRPHRVVTFVTDHELRHLRALTDASGRSLSAIAHDLLVLSLQHPELPLSEGRDKNHEGARNEPT
jgi:hypothetical protein